MTEQKEQQNTPTPNSDIPASSEQDLSVISNLKFVGAPSSGSTLISQANAADSLVKHDGGVQIDRLGMAKQIDGKRNITLGTSGAIGGMIGKYHNIYRRLFLISFFIILVTGTASIVLSLYNRYIYFASQAIPDVQYQDYINKYKKGESFVDQTLNISNYQKYAALSISNSGEEANVDTVINESRLTYVQKKDLLQKALNDFSPILQRNTQKTEQLKEDISKYGFFSKELYDMLANEDYSTSIKNYLLSLEIIKFSSAIKVFGYLETFISSLSNALGVLPAQVETGMQALAARGEKDIVIYLNNCYLNPYEVDYECNLIGDFDRYYKIIDKETTKLDTRFFKNVMFYVDSKLEQTDLPSFSIIFRKYDPTQKQISFTVDVNTFKQDELALIKKGIISPHIFILSNLLNLIKQSVFVISEDIDAKTIKISPKTIKIGTSVFNVNNSVMNFVLPIQKGSEREISDYMDPNFTSSP